MCAYILVVRFLSAIKRSVSSNNVKCSHLKQGLLLKQYELDSDCGMIDIHNS